MQWDSEHDKQFSERVSDMVIRGIARMMAVQARNEQLQ